MLLDQAVLGLHRLPRGFLGRRKLVFDELEDVRKTGQIKHQHDQALNAGRNAKLVRAVPQVVQQITVEHGFALLGQAQGAIDFATRFARHQAVQKAHIGAGHGHIHHEIRAGEAEQPMQILLIEQHRMQHQPSAIASVQDGNRQRNLGIAGDDFGHHIRALVAKEQAAEHLYLQIGAQRQPLQTLANACSQQRHITAQVFKLGLQLKVPDHTVQRGHQRIQVAWIKHPKSRPARRIQVFRAHHRAHKDEVVVKVRAVQDLGGDGVKEGLGQLGLQMPNHQADVVQLDLLPQRHGQGAGGKILRQARHALLHPLVIKRYALALGALLRGPVRLLKPLLGGLGGRPKQLVVAVHALHHGLGNGIGLRRIQTLGKHGRRRPRQSRWRSATFCTARW